MGRIGRARHRWALVAPAVLLAASCSRYGFLSGQGAIPGGGDAGAFSGGEGSGAEGGADDRGDATGGDAFTGDGSVGDGNRGDPRAGDTIVSPGDLRSGDLRAGDTNMGDTNVGDTNTGDTNMGDTNPGDFRAPGESSGDINGPQAGDFNGPPVGDFNGPPQPPTAVQLVMCPAGLCCEGEGASINWTGSLDATYYEVRWDCSFIPRASLMLNNTTYADAIAPPVNMGWTCGGITENYEVCSCSPGGCTCVAIVDPTPITCGGGCCAW